MKQKTTIIVGAGYGGMALANLLGKAGYKVDVYEKNSQPGGRIAAIKKSGFTFDIGPSWYLMPEIFEQYYSIFGESANRRLDLMRFSPGYKVYFQNSHPVAMNGDVIKDKDIFESIEKGAGAKLEKYVEQSTEVYNAATRYFLYNNFLHIGDFVKWDIIKRSPRMLSLTFQNLDTYVRRSFRDIRLRQILEYHMVFLGSSPFQAPAIYSLMSHLDFKSGVYYPRRGMVSIVDDMISLGSRSDIAYHYDSDVREIIVENGVAKGIRLRSGETVYADVVVSNADLKFTETQLLSKNYQSFSETYWEKRQPGPGALLVSCGIRGKLPQLLHHNLFFVERWRENFDAIYVDKEIPDEASIYICNPTKTDKSLAPKGHENIFILMPIPAGVSLKKDQQDELANKVIDVFGRTIGEPKLRERVTNKLVFGPEDFKSQYNAWAFNAFGGESHLLKQSVIFRTPNKSKKVDGLYYVGAGTLPGIGLPMCLISAQLTYKRIVGNDKPGPLSMEDF